MAAGSKVATCVGNVRPPCGPFSQNLLREICYEAAAFNVFLGLRVFLSQVFRASRPHGRYELDLSRPYDRTLLRMLYKTSDRLGLGFDQTFRDISAEGFFSHPPKSSQGLYQIPQAGKVWMTFTMDKVLEDRMAAQGGADFFSLIRCHSELLRIKPCRSTLVALLAQWKRMEGLGEDQSIMIDALSKDRRSPNGSLGKGPMPRGR